MAKEFQGKVVLITGGGRGFGAHAARMFADRGADVAITYSASEQKAEALASELRERGVRAMAIRSDLGDTASAKPTVAAVVAEFGKLDILVNMRELPFRASWSTTPTSTTTRTTACGRSTRSARWP
jgi:3-oxoacyl-[acyl-carrier protein] reductase